MLDKYKIHKELSKEKYTKQKFIDSVFNDISEILIHDEVNEAILVNMFSDLCSHIQDISKDLVDYSIKYGAIDVREDMIKRGEIL